MIGEEMLAQAIWKSADTIYAVPGFPVTGLIDRTGAKMVINEKVALELALGDSLAGKRSCVIVKHVGMNALVDPLVHATFQGLIGGLVIIAGDDPAARSTMTVQDSRSFGPIAHIPVFEGVSPSVIPECFSASERYSRVALLRITAEELNDVSGQRPGDTGIFNGFGTGEKGRLADPDLTMYGRAARAFHLSHDIETENLAPYPLPRYPEYPVPFSRKKRGYTLSLCADCPFRGLFTMMQMKSLSTICDTGCSLIAQNHPFSFGLASYGMGSAIAVAARSTRVALIGDYALLHSGIQALIEVYRHNYPLLCVVMVNRCMGMTGGQAVPDPTPYIGFADPISCDAADLASLDRLLIIPDRPVTILVYGQCPEVIEHETVAC